MNRKNAIEIIRENRKNAREIIRENRKNAREIIRENRKMLCLVLNGKELLSTYEPKITLTHSPQPAPLLRGRDTDTHAPLKTRTESNPPVTKGSTSDVKGSTSDIKGSSSDIKGSTSDIKGSTDRECSFPARFGLESIFELLAPVRHLYTHPTTTDAGSLIAAGFPKDPSCSAWEDSLTTDATVSGKPNGQPAGQPGAIEQNETKVQIWVLSVSKDRQETGVGPDPDTFSVPANVRGGIEFSSGGAA
eukprot:1195589-Prorocentrum_minimum.AAC.1